MIHTKFDKYRNARIVTTGYELSAKEVALLSPEEQLARANYMLESRAEIKRMKDLDVELMIC